MHAPAAPAHRTLLPHLTGADGDRPALRRRDDAGSWKDTTYAELAAEAGRLGRGFVALGIQPGDRVAVLAATRPEWTVIDLALLAAGAVVVPIYATNSPQECEWVLGDSDAVAVIAEDAAQLAKVEAVRARLPRLRETIVIEPAAGARPLAEVRALGEAVEPGVLERRMGAVAPEDPCTFIYTSGTTGPPKGCVLTHANVGAMLEMIDAAELLCRPGDVVYLYLPLAHAFALIVQLAALQAGACIAYWGGDSERIAAELAEVRPTYLPTVPRLLEKMYASIAGRADAQVLAGAVEVARRVRALRAAGAPVPAELSAALARADAGLFAPVRAAFGGRLREALTGAAPIATEVLELFWAAGVPVLEGYGMTEASAGVAISTIEHHRFGAVGRAVPGVDLRIAEDGEVLVRSAGVFAGYHRADRPRDFGEVVDGWLHTGDLGRLDDDGYLWITGRKKDIIITAGGKNIAPANLEADLMRTRFISHAVMHGDRRPYPVVLVTLDEQEILPWAAERGLPADVAALARTPAVHALVEDELARANARYAPVEQAKRFAVLPRDLTQEAGELTPTLKVKRAVVQERHRAVLDALYDAPRSPR